MGFTKEEIAAELQRREEAIRRTRVDQAKALDNSRLQGADTSCLHCGNPMHSWQATDPDNPLCDICL